MLPLIVRQDVKSYIFFLDWFCALTYLHNKNRILFLRFRLQSIERAMDLTDSFTWEDLPTRDADTGHLTAAGRIPLTTKYSKSGAIAVLCFHTVQSTWFTRMHKSVSAISVKLCFCELDLYMQGVSKLFELWTTNLNVCM